MHFLLYNIVNLVRKVSVLHSVYRVQAECTETANIDMGHIYFFIIINYVLKHAHNLRLKLQIPQIFHR